MGAPSLKKAVCDYCALGPSVAAESLPGLTGISDGLRAEFFRDAVVDDAGALINVSIMQHAARSPVSVCIAQAMGASLGFSV